jgi:type III restriction enzyme
VHKALCKYDAYRFSTLKSYFPHLKSTREFVTDGAYLGDIKVVIESPGNEPTIEHFYNSCINVLGKIANEISTINITYGGTKEFKSKHLHEIFKNTRVTYSDPHDGGVGISQNDSSVPKKWKIDLSKEDWFVYTDNFGTSEEKAFVAYFQTFVDSLKGKYDKVYLVRNERLLKLYSFSDGEGFEPDYLLFLHKNKGDGFEQYQIFIEPKGAHLISDDIWKEEFLLKLEKEAIAVKTFVDDNEYHIWGFHFFNQDQRSKEFSEDMSKL